MHQTPSDQTPKKACHSIALHAPSKGVLIGGEPSFCPQHRALCTAPSIYTLFFDKYGAHEEGMRIIAAWHDFRRSARLCEEGREP